MKKITALLLSLFMLVPMMTMGISATTEVASSTVEDALVLHHDFSQASQVNGVQRFRNLANNSGSTTAGGLLRADTADVIWDEEEGTLRYKPGGTAAAPFLKCITTMTTHSPRSPQTSAYPVRVCAI